MPRVKTLDGEVQDLKLARVHKIGQMGAGDAATFYVHADLTATLKLVDRKVKVAVRNVRLNCDSLDVEAVAVDKSKASPGSVVDWLRECTRPTTAVVPRYSMTEAFNHYRKWGGRLLQPAFTAYLVSQQRDLLRADGAVMKLAAVVFKEDFVADDLTDDDS